MTDFTNRRQFLGQSGATILTLPFLSQYLGIPVATQAQAEQPISRLPADYKELFNLSDEQKIMVSALVASGGDAVAYYTPGEKAGEFVLGKHIDLYQANDTEFSGQIAFNSKANTVFPKEGADGVMTHMIPVRAPDGQPKGVIVLHESKTLYDAAEPEYCRAAKRKMAMNIVSEHADLFGVSGALLKQREQVHRSLDHKREFFLTLAKDMFSTLTRRIEVDPQILPAVKAAKDADELKSALRKAENATASDQYPHVLGVSDLMEHALKKAVNGDHAHPVMTAAQVDLLEVLTLLHDVGKTQAPSHFLAPHPDGDLAAREFEISRNGSHPLFTLMTLLMYPNDALDAATHHNGLHRYGAEEIAELKTKGRVSKDFNGFTELRGGDVPAQELPQLAKIMRVVDVTEAITGRVDIPLHKAVEQLGSIGQSGDSRKKIRLGEDGKPVINPDTIDPDSLCFLIVNDVFKAYGEQRVAETNGWACKKKGEFEGKSKYDAAELEKVSTEILKTFGWDKPEARAAKEQEIRAAIAADPILRDKEQPQQQQGAAQSMGR